MAEKITKSEPLEFDEPSYEMNDKNYKSSESSKSLHLPNKSNATEETKFVSSDSVQCLDHPVPTISISEDSLTSTTEETKIISVVDEINRGKEYSRLREQSHSCLHTIVEPIYKQKTQIYPDVFVKKLIVPDYIPNYGECRHTKRKVVERDLLNNGEHISMLAKPKIVRQK